MSVAAVGAPAVVGLELARRKVGKTGHEQDRQWALRRGSAAGSTMVAASCLFPAVAANATGLGVDECDGLRGDGGSADPDRRWPRSAVAPIGGGLNRRWLRAPEAAAKHGWGGACRRAPAGSVV
ncbi:hypothetical protein GCM10022380_81790 [Amycolatopsis tucumanensis]|uniref:Uncharacterized protein n=1 Tax=Amycolatopsis tucumanensis TaxID=401106 RepID=A0ABP7JQH4_9PSEU